MKYQLYLNMEKDEVGRLVGFMDGYLPGHKMDLAAAGNVNERPGDTDAGILEELYEIYNIDHPAGYRNRSMSMGDVVVLGLGTPDVRAYAVARFGFDPVPNFNFAVSTL